MTQFVFTGTGILRFQVDTYATSASGPTEVAADLCDPDTRPGTRGRDTQPCGGHVTCGETGPRAPEHRCDCDTYQDSDLKIGMLVAGL